MMVTTPRALVLEKQGRQLSFTFFTNRLPSSTGEVRSFALSVCCFSSFHRLDRPACGGGDTAGAAAAGASSVPMERVRVLARVYGQTSFVISHYLICIYIMTNKFFKYLSCVL